MKIQSKTDGEMPYTAEMSNQDGKIVQKQNSDWNNQESCFIYHLLFVYTLLHTHTPGIREEVGSAQIDTTSSAGAPVSVDGRR